LAGKITAALTEPQEAVYQPALPGFYDLVYEAGEIEDFNKNPYGDLISEIALIRIYIRRALRETDGIKDLGEIIRVLNALGLAASRLARLLEVQHKLSQGSPLFAQAIEQSILKLGKEMGIYDAD
jgi:hypothetical protein